MVPYIRKLANEVGEAYRQILANLRQRWKAKSENYMEEQKGKEKVKKTYNFDEYHKKEIWGTVILSKEGVSGQEAAAASIAYKDEQIRINSKSDHVDINQKHLEAAFEGYDYLTGRKINILEAISIISTGIIMNFPGLRNANRNIGITSKPFNISKVKKTLTGKVTPPKLIEPPKTGGTDEVGTPPRYGERRISKELYKKLRSKTSTKELQDKMNEGVILPIDDPVLEDKKVKTALEAHHIVPMDKIDKMENFEKLTFEQQVKNLNNPENFTALRWNCKIDKRYGSAQFGCAYERMV